MPQTIRTYSEANLLFLHIFGTLIQIIRQTQDKIPPTPNLSLTTTLTAQKLKLKRKTCISILAIAYLYLILLCHGDIEKNPGPAPTRLGNTSSLSTYFLNARSMKSINANRNKLDEFKDLLHLTNPDMIGVSETWLNKNVTNTQIDPNNKYSIYRKDRVKKKGGGVLLLVSNKIRSQQKDTLEMPTLKHNEIIVVEIEPTLGKKFLTIVAYRSQKDPIPIFIENLENTLTNCLRANYTDLLLIGDFNMEKIKWDPLIDIALPRQQQLFLDLTHQYGLTQHNKNPSTKKGNILDLVLSNFPEKLSKVYSSTYTYRTDHYLLDFNLNMTVDRIEPPPRTILNFKHTNHHGLDNDLENLQLHRTLQTLDNPNSKWDTWSTSIMHAITKNIPKLTIKANNNPPWMDKPLLQQLRRKNLALTKAKALDTREAWAYFKHLHNRLKNRITQKQRNYIFILCSTLKENPRQFWTLLTNQTKNKGSPSRIFFNNKEANNPYEIATLLNSFFHSVFTPIPKLIQLPYIQQYQDPNLSTINLTVNEVQKQLEQLNYHKAQGPDKIPTIILKQKAQALAPSITNIFNSSLEQGIVPDKWKKANIIPVHKKGSKLQATNYRPISLLPTLSKVLERCIYNKIIDLIIPKIAKQQHGFLKNRSTTSQLLSIFSKINNILDKGDQADIIYFDLSKAFDSVPHHLLLHKLKSFGINGTLLTWIKDYLTNRFQRVIINGTESGWLPVTSGVPQGSILGPLLFLLYINDLPQALSPHTLCAIFADDTKIARKITNPHEAQILQNDINALHTWSTTWGLRFNSSKCTIISTKRRNHPYRHPYTLNNALLPRVNNMLDLGITINTQLQWNTHITNITKKANQRLWLIKRTIGYNATKQAKTLSYTALVRTLLEYGTPVWSPSIKENLIRLEAVQKQATNYIINNPPREAPNHQTYKQRLIACNLLPTSYRREFYDIIFFLKSIRHMTQFNINDYTNLITDGTDRRTRLRTARLNLTQINNRLESTARFYPTRISRLWNNLPLDLRKTLMASNSFQTIKVHLTKFYHHLLNTKFDPGNPCTWVLACRCPTCRPY